MIKGTFIARVFDGAIFFESKPEANENVAVSILYEKTKDFLKTIDKKPERLSVDMSDNLDFK